VRTDRTDSLPREIHHLRDQRWRRRREIRLRSAGEARRFVRRIGFCLFWPAQGIELPNLLQAIAGNARPLSAGYDDPAIGKSWNWKDDSLDKRWWYYGKLLRKRATLVSLELLPAFYALSENYGEPQDYLVEYQEGRLSSEAKAVYETLLENGPLDTVRLRKEARLTAAQAKARFDRALVELQAGLKVLPVGVAEAGAWKYAFIYELVDRWYPDLQERARPIGTTQARLRILNRYLENVIVADRPTVAHVLGWTAGEVERVAARLIESGQARSVLLPNAARPLLTPLRYAARLERLDVGPPKRRSPAPARGSRRRTSSRPSAKSRRTRERR
jgi:hypothetical protein